MAMLRFGKGAAQRLVRLAQRVRLERKHVDIGVGFLRAGMLGYGGGPSSIPLMHREVVQRYGWMNDQEFTDVLALANTLPGPIATKMAGYIGYRTGGVIGMAVAVMATVLPTVLLMIGLIGALSAFRQSPIVAGMTQAVSPVIAVMLGTMAYDFVRDAGKGLGWLTACQAFAGCYLLLAFVNLHPGILIGALLMYGAISPPAEGKAAAEQKGRTLGGGAK